jgi:REP element-mobilizing transposase RayT
MARKWSNLNLPGALHYVTGNFLNRFSVFSESECCRLFLQQLRTIKQKWPAKLIAYVLMPDHFHLVCNPRDGRIREFCRDLKSLAAKEIVQQNKRFKFPKSGGAHRVWQESFKAAPLWSGWMISQKISYVHANPVKARLVKSAGDYYWSSYRSFYRLGNEPLKVDYDWWWEDDFGEVVTGNKGIGMAVIERTSSRQVSWYYLFEGAPATPAQGPSKYLGMVVRHSTLSTEINGLATATGGFGGGGAALAPFLTCSAIWIVRCFQVFYLVVCFY